LPGSTIPLFKLKVAQKGKIKDIKEIVVRITGLPTCLNGQLVDLGRGVRGIVMGFDQNDVLVLALGDPARLRMGTEVTGVDEPFLIPVAREFVGRMLNAMGEPCDRRDAIVAESHVPVFKDSPPITSRAPVSGFLFTGTKVVDSIIPLAKGQRQLIVGDRMTGKTAIAIDAILSQKGRNVLCIYCGLGKSMSALEKVVNTLRERQAFEYTLLMVAADNAPVGEQYLVPFSAASIGEYFAMQGRDVLVVFDDLTKHAWAYRQLSLLLDRPPGREAYPGDIFYVQTQLMERAGQFNQEHGGGSMTFLGVAETQQGDMSGYIPSNLASMCDGQICMSSTFFAEGFRPAIDFTLSLSIIGSKVQPPILRDLSRTLRADFARYMEVVQLSKMQSGVSGEAERLLKRGQAIMSVLQQPQNKPVGLAEQVMLLYALDKGVMNGMTKPDANRFCGEIGAFVVQHNPGLASQLETSAKLSLELRAGLDDAFTACLAQWSGAGAVP
jgi:F-type H+-transporting ATPase subunit alpha